MRRDPSKLFLLALIALPAACGDDAPDEPGRVRNDGGSATDVDPARAALALGHQLAANGDLEGATEAYRRAAMTDPDLAEAHAALGRTLVPMALVSAGRGGAAPGADGGVKLGRDDAVLDEAIAALERALELEPSDVENIYWTGRALHVRGRNDDAIERLKQVVALDPEHGLAHKRLGLVYLDAGEVELAAKSFADAEPLLPEDPGVPFQLGNVLSEEDAAAARDAYLRATAIDPTFAPAYNGLVGVLNRLGELEAANEAKADYERWNGFEDRLGMALQRAEKNRDKPAAQFAVADLYSIKRRFDKAVEYYRRGIELDPTDPAGHVFCGVALRKLGENAVAKQHLEEALFLAPDGLEPRFELILVCDALDEAARRDELVAELEAAAASLPAADRVLFADVLARIGRKDAAKAQLDAVLEANPDDEAAKRALAGLDETGG